MDIFINNKPQQIPEQSTITDTLAALKITATKGIAIAINNDVIAKAEWETYALSDQDKVTLIQATQGG